MASYSMTPAQLAPATSAAFRRSFTAWHKRVAQAARGLPTGGAARILSEDVAIEATMPRPLPRVMPEKVPHGYGPPVAFNADEHADTYGYESCGTAGTHVIRYVGADGGKGEIRIKVPALDAAEDTVSEYQARRNKLLAALTRGTGPIARSAADSAPVESAAPVPVPVALAPAAPVAPVPVAHRGWVSAASPTLIDADALADAIRAAGGSAGNLALRDRLTWDAARYDDAKVALLSAGTVRTGRGRGGSLALVDVAAAPISASELATMREQLIFAHRDERYARETVDRLLLEKDALIAERDNALAAADTDAADLSLAHAEIARLRAQVAGLLSAARNTPTLAHLPAVAALAAQGRA